MLLGKNRTHRVKIANDTAGCVNIDPFLIVAAAEPHQNEPERFRFDSLRIDSERDLASEVLGMIQQR